MKFMEKAMRGEDFCGISARILFRQALAGSLAATISDANPAGGDSMSRGHERVNDAADPGHQRQQVCGRPDVHSVKYNTQLKQPACFPAVNAGKVGRGDALKASSSMDKAVAEHAFIKP